MKDKLATILTVMFTTDKFWRVIVVLSMILTTLCICVAIIGYYKIVEVDVNIKKQFKEMSKEIKTKR
jgi:hypothetical protein